MVVPTGTLVLEAVHSSGLLTPTHYVSPTGTAVNKAAATSGVGNAGCASAANAMAWATAGEVWQFATGRYTVTGTNSNWVPALNPTSDGTESDPIVFQAETIHGVDFQFGSGAGPVIGSDGHDWITWYGFKVDEALCPTVSDGSCAILHSCQHCTLEYCDLDGNGNPGIGEGSVLHAAVFAAASGDITIRNCYLHDIDNATHDGNASCIIIIDVGGTNIIEHNEIARGNQGFDIKRSHDDWMWPERGKWHIRYNYIHDHQDRGVFGYQLILGTDEQDPNKTVDVYQNLIVNCTSAGAVGTSSEGSHATARLIRFVNNTVINCGMGWSGCLNANALDATANHRLWNNIFVDCGRIVCTYDPLSSFVDATRIGAEHNVYHGYTTAFATFLYDTGGQYDKTLAEWKANGQDSAVGNGLASVEADPLFTDEGNSDYTLQAGSPARNRGVDMLNLKGQGTTAAIDCGCYITGTETIGVE